MDLKKEILEGKIFIYPTDTIYGIGCDATNEESVKKNKGIKKRDIKPFSVIAPSIEWIKKNCIIPKNLEIKRYLPGAYTLILEKKDEKFLREVSPTKTLGVRIPDNDFTREVQKSGVPFVTTSVNFSGEKSANKIEDISNEIQNKADYIFNSGKLSGKPSTLIIEEKEIPRN